MLLQFDGTLIIIALSFIIFMVIMQKIFYAPVSEVREERNDYINENISSAQARRQEAEDIIQNYKAKISQAKVKASQVVSDSAASANREKSRAVAENSKEAAKKVKLARQEIKSNKDSARETLSHEVLALAHSISTKILGEEIPMSGITKEMTDKELNG